MTQRTDRADRSQEGLPCLPADRPFLRSEARRLGVPDHVLGRLVLAGWLRRPIAGVYHSAALPESLHLRIECLQLVVPADAVVTDRTAAWLWGASMALAPHDDVAVPPVSVFRPRGYRLRNDLAASGSRDLLASDVTELDGLRVTTPLRTACDLGRLLHRRQAIAALDALARDAGLSVPQLHAEVERFRGFRGVRQLRALAPLIDGRAESPGESMLRLHWFDCGLPAPQPQLEVTGPDGCYYLDLGLWRPRFAAEYDGAAWHGEERQLHDLRRRSWIENQLGFTLCVVRREHLLGLNPEVEKLLRHRYAVAEEAARQSRHRIRDRAR